MGDNRGMVVLERRVVVAKTLKWAKTSKMECEIYAREYTIVGVEVTTLITGLLNFLFCSRVREGEFREKVVERWRT